jgi:hypothetical protein
LIIFLLLRLPLHYQLRLLLKLHHRQLLRLPLH